MNSEEIKDRVCTALEDLKGNDIVALSVDRITSVADWMVIVSGTSNRHVKSLSDNVQLELKKAGSPAIGVEGTDAAEWVLVDFGGVIVHVMLPTTRMFYDLESLWTLKPEASSDSADEYSAEE